MHTLITDLDGIDFAVDYEADDGRVTVVAIRPHDNEDDFQPMLQPRIVSLMHCLAENDYADKQAGRAERDREIDDERAFFDRTEALAMRERRII